jgi:hypothetical protein
MRTFQSNKFYFLFSDSDVKRIEDKFSPFKYNCLKHGLLCEFVDINSKKDFSTIFRKIKFEAKESGIIPYIHFECHGNKLGLTLKSNAKIFWPELVKQLTEINISIKNNLFVSFSTCFASYISLLLIDKLSRGNKFRTPVFGLVAPVGEIRNDEYDRGYEDYFNAIIETGNIDNGIDALSNNIKDSPGYLFMTCEGLLKKIMDSLIEYESERKFKNKVKFNAHLTELARNYLYRTGKFITRQELENLAEITSSEKLYLDFFNALRTNFLMLDLYPQHENRYSHIQNITNWNVFTDRIQ